jgi:uracil-DNA glycosylase
MQPGVREELLREVYACQSCNEAYGFERPGPGLPYFKFPPTIGAAGRNDLLFVGINPRRSGSNRELHSSLMANFGAFEALALNWNGPEPYITKYGAERHYGAHVEFVEGVFGSGAKFEEHAAVTELYFCATTNSEGLPKVGSQCADRYLERILMLVSPKVVICVGKQVWTYFGDRYRVIDARIQARFGAGMAEVVTMPHPNDRLSKDERDRRMREAIKETRSVLGKS